MQSGRRDEDHEYREAAQDHPHHSEPDGRPPRFQRESQAKFKNEKLLFGRVLFQKEPAEKAFRWVNVSPQVNANELTNGVINAAFMLLFKDSIRLFAAYNEGIINLLGRTYARRV